ncbi:glycosyltransferase family 4 protein [Flavobacterium sp.]|uniref:glycosyltransferase family 4 protein n=1 Tax=Flavobacterium sp. TaxID=239 RepID=UPI003750D178
MRILQLIDSLDAGGAERMAVNYANSLSKNVAFSGLVATRKEGILKSEIDKSVSYLFLNKKKSFDFKATQKLIFYCKSNKIDTIQAHTSSYFIAVLVKFMLPQIRIIWHDHYGLSEFLNQRKSIALASASYFFSGIVVVNFQLKEWAEKKLKCKKIIYLPNFTSTIENEIVETQLKGINGKRILCLANLRPQKNHFFLLKVATAVVKKHPEWSFHLVGQDFNDNYSLQLSDAIKTESLSNNVYLYGSKKDIQNIINQSDIAVLTSQSEGLPISLLEYGLNSKPVVTTAVGEIPFIIKNKENGFIVDKDDLVSFINNLETLINDIPLRKKMGSSLLKTIQINNSEDSIIKSYLNWLANN